MTPDVYKAQHNIRIVTAASLFDGHDAAINIMRRIMQSTGAEVIHLGHNRSVDEVVNAAIQEDAQAVAITSYQGGHVEYFTYMADLLKERGAGHIKIFGGGGGTILPDEIEQLHQSGITRIYSPEDGRLMGLQGMINDVIQQSDVVPEVTIDNNVPELLRAKNPLAIARAMTFAEQATVEHKKQWNALQSVIDESLAVNKEQNIIPVLGITGTGGAGKSSLTDEFVRRFLRDFPEKTVAIISIDPSKRKTGGALLGDRIRMNAINTPRVFMRSVATRQHNTAISRNIAALISIARYAQFDLIIVETAGIGQSGSEITDIADVSLYVMTPEFGAATQLEKIDMIDYADIIALNKFDKAGAMDAERDVKKQFQRAHGLWQEKPDSMPVYGTIASQFNDPGMNALYQQLINLINQKSGAEFPINVTNTGEMSKKQYIIPPDRSRYLAEIADEHERYKKQTNEQVVLARKYYQVSGARDVLNGLE